MKLFFAILIAQIFGSAAMAASSGGFGANFALGAPFVSQFGLNYQFSDKFGMSAGSDSLKIDAGVASLNLSLIEVMANYHPFGGAFFIGLGVGQESLKTTATDSTTATTASIEVTATTAIAKLGWMWGLSDGGFWFGLDVAYISPSGSKETITAPGVPTTSTAYTDAVDAAEKFGSTAYTNITFARLGWIF